MRAISLQQPFASLIACGAKKYEARTWKTNYRGPLAIHATVSANPRLRDYFRKWQEELYAAGYIVPEQLPRGAFVGVVELADCKPAADVMITDYDAELVGNADYCYLFTLAKAKQLSVPMPAKGAQAMWRPTAEDTRTLQRFHGDVPLL